MPQFQSLKRGPDFDLASTDVERTCVWSLTVDGKVEHSTARRLFAAKPRAGSACATEWRNFWPIGGRATVDRAVRQAAAGHVASFRMMGGASETDRTYWETTISPVRSRNGTVQSLLATSRDVTSEVEREAVADTVAQLLPVPLAVKDVETGCYILWNRAAEAAFEICMEQVVGGSALVALDPDVAQVLADAEAAAVGSGERQVRKVVSAVGGQARAFELLTLATFDDFGARHIITLFSDTTEQHVATSALSAAVSAAQAASVTKSRFLAVMSHELRTPLNGVMAGADMLARLALPPRGKELVQLIQGSSAALEKLLSSILDFAVIEAGGVTIDPGPFDLGELVREVAGLAGLSAEAKGVLLETEIQPDIDLQVVGDAVRLRQVLTNLMTNSVKFTDQGRVTLHASRAGENVRFRVVDTGIGFDDSVRAKIFDRFQQADTSITRRFGGTGLGLAIAHELVSLMGGTLDCQGRPGAGAEFWFDIPLPVAVGVGTASSRSAPEAMPPTADPARLKVLAADDHPTNRRVVELLLEGVAEVESVADGAEAVSAYRAESYDLILMDMQMPVMDGVSAVRTIRDIEREEQRAPVPILMLSANAAAEHVAASLDAGANQHLAKPITADRLFGAIGELLN